MCYDFGMWFRILKNLDTSNIENITLVNDSMILLNPNKLLKILNEYNDKKMWGFTDSDEINYHIQSYFLVFNLETISLLKQFVDNSNIHNDINLDKMDIVQKYEIGISQFIISNNISITPLYKINDVLEVNSICESIGENSSYRLWDRLLILEMPLVKKTKECYKIDKL
jgi:rhamnosyltransferase